MLGGKGARFHRSWPPGLLKNNNIQIGWVRFARRSFIVDGCWHGAMCASILCGALNTNVLGSVDVLPVR
jgi:hypothetical protein